MKCNTIQKRLSAYLDGELTAEKSQAIARHVQTCAQCAQQFQLWQNVEARLDDGQKFQADAWFLTRLQARLREQTTPVLRPAWSPLQKVFVPATIIAGLVFGVLLGVQLKDLLEPAATTPTSYSYIDSNFTEPVPSGSLTATYISLDKTN